MIVVYIASPYSIGNKEKNVRASQCIGNELINNGFCPIIPLLSHYQHIYYPQTYEKWLEMDFEIIKRCDCVLVLPGESKGVDMEIVHAIRNEIPVHYSLEQFYLWAYEWGGVKK